jgi:hypothetical protein
MTIGDGNEVSVGPVGDVYRRTTTEYEETLAKMGVTAHFSCEEE